MTIPETDLILNPDGSVYHLNLLPGDVAETIITVGDQDRVAQVSKYFDRIDLKKGKREFLTHTGWLGQKRVTVISTGIGTDNIDIVLNELDALANIDFATRKVKDKLLSLDIVRLGTSGALQADIPLDSVLIADYGLGFDALMNFYPKQNTDQEAELLQHLDAVFTGINLPKSYLTAASLSLVQKIGFGLPSGITATAPGFYAPQGRQVRAANAVPNFIEKLQSFQHQQQKITNLEMETAGIYALAKVLGHQALSVNVILANRVSLQFSKNPQLAINHAIKLILDRL
ncbi:nucleoside phosphorylase [Mucilaginibacter sp.]|uniref:nucleoside phosphorylase n=1 Tax=Mucilaginibacter sp. TaxID=1882438 RepID=UPI003AFFF52F